MRSCFLLVVLFFVSCAPAIPLEGAACPCVEGWVCCPGLDVCAAEFDRCDTIPGPLVTPGELTLGVNRRARFTATGKNVTWELEDALVAGSIDAEGLYIAPPSPGVFHLVVRSSFGARRVTITVRELQLSLLAGDYGGPGATPIDGVGQNARIRSTRDGQFIDGNFYFLDDLGTGPDFILRKLDIATRRVSTLFTSERMVVDGPPGIGKIGNLGLGMGRTGDHRLAIWDAPCLREMDTRTNSLSTTFCATASSLLAQCSSFTGDDEAIYCTASPRNVLVRWLRGTEATTAMSIAGQLDVRGEADGAPGMLDSPANVVLSRYDRTLYFTDQQGRSVRAFPLTGTGHTTVMRTAAMNEWVQQLAVRPSPPSTGASHDPFVVLLNSGFVKSENRDFSGLGYVTGIGFETNDMLVAATSSVLIRLDARTWIEEVLAGKEISNPGLEDGVGASARFAFGLGATVAIHDDVAWIAENATKRIRTVTHDGRVTTRFSDVDNVNSLVVTDTHVYATFITLFGSVKVDIRRAPIGGGAWETIATNTFAAMVYPRLIGAMGDGRIAVVAEGGVFFLDPNTFTLTAERHERLSAVSTFGDGFTAVLDPTGGVFYTGADGLTRYDFATRKHVEAGPLPPQGTAWNRSMSFDGRNLYMMSMSDPFSATAFVSMFEPDINAWKILVGSRNAGAVVLGPLSSALLHEPGAIGVFPNGDVLVLDRAENSVLIVE